MAVELFEPWMIKAMLVVAVIAGADAMLYALIVRLDRECFARMLPRHSIAVPLTLATRPAPAGARDMERKRAAAA